MTTFQPRTICALLLAALIGFTTGPGPARAEPGQFLLISDIHFDPFYDGSLFDQLQAQPAEAWAGILETSRPAGFNPRGTDSNYALLRSSLEDARRRNPDPDFILYPGDLMAHQWQGKYDRLARKSHTADPEAYRAFTSRAIRFLAGEFRRAFPRTAILPTLGNDDSYCGDYMVEPDGPFLTMFAAVWSPLLGPGTAPGSFRETFSRGGYYTLRLPSIKNCRLIVLNSVFFSVNYDNVCGARATTPALDQLRWLDETLGRASAAGEIIWLLMHVPPGINSFNSAGSVTQGGPASTFWQPELTARFLQLIKRYPGTIRAAFAGHTHMDDYRVIRLDGEPVLLCKIAPAISPIFGNNPGYQTYQYDRDGGVFENFQTYYWNGLDSARKSPVPAAGRWALEYDFRESYGFDALTARTVDHLAAKIRTDPAARRNYTAFYGVSAPSEITPQTLDVYRCAIPNVTAPDFLECLGGAPKPRRPLAFPDRRPATVPVTR